MTFGLIAKWYVIPKLDLAPRAEALLPLLLLPAFRYIGLTFLISGVVSAHLSAVFAKPAAYGDLLAALLALLAAIALRNSLVFAIPLTWIFNVVGTLDLFNALLQGVLNLQAGQLGGAYFVPAVAVPALLVTHFLMFRLLLRPSISET